MYEFEVLQELGDVGEAGKALKVVSWGGRAGKLDLRTWRREGDELKPGKGLTLTDKEARGLYEVLGRYLAG